ncbi:MAG: Competence protein ComM [Proteobacteria bacterium]|nr:Competence protein ComM [Pseudomonadota bacterium]
MEEAVALSKVKHAKCATLYGNKAYEVDVESTLVRALPGFSIVGIADQSIQESRERMLIVKDNWTSSKTIGLRQR